MRRQRQRQRRQQEEGRRWEPVSCPFCEELVARPKALGPLLESQGGRCGCGAVYAADESGSRGGQALVDGLTVLCDGDVSAAMGLTHGADYELEEVGYDPRTFSVMNRQAGRRSAARAKVFFFKRTSPEG